MKRVYLFLFMSCSGSVLAQEKVVGVAQDSVYNLSEVKTTSDALLGGKFKAKNIAGSNYYISSEELKQFNYSDVNRILRSVPGVNIIEEEGFGHRPNIGLRGVNPSRSSKITLMEDGVLIAPAPYSAPAAYYFPVVNRIKGFEILKGGSQIQYGPNTTAGAINMISTQIPSALSGEVIVDAGKYNTKSTNVYANVGDSYANVGYLLEYTNRNSDGFKTIDYSKKSTGFNGKDFVGKIRFNTDVDAKVYQSLILKVQHSDEIANETYLGLTEDDFNQNPYKRYLASEADNIDFDHEQFMLTHFIKPNSNLTITTKAYKNMFNRNWYKLDKVSVAGKDYSISSVINDPTKYNIAYDYVSGNVDSPENSLKIKANNRKYGVWGIQSVANYKFVSGSIKHDIDFGIRYVEDYEDRFDWIDGYSINNKTLLHNTSGVPGTDTNKIADAKAMAAHVLYNFNYNKLTITPGLRYENITARSRDYGKTNIDRNQENISIVENKVDVFIPGMGVLYRFTPVYNGFASVHKGFSPPTATIGEDVEESINYELGFRANKNSFSAEVVGFYNDYKNLQGADTYATGGTGSGDLFNAGKAKVQGAEVLVSYNALNNMSTYFKLPVSLSYTYTDTELLSNYQSNSGWGLITAGDEIPYIPKNQLTLMAGLTCDRFNANISGKFTDEFRTKPGQGEIPADVLIKSNFVLDAAVKYTLHKNMNLMANATNIMNTKYAVSRVPAGLMPGMPFNFNAGIQIHF